MTVDSTYKYRKIKVNSSAILRAVTFLNKNKALTFLEVKGGKDEESIF